MYVYIQHVYRCPQKPEEGVGFPGIKVSDGCESEVDTRNQTSVLCNSSKCS